MSHVHGVPENFVSLEQVVLAVFAQGLVVGDEGSIDIAPLVEALTGLPMAKYELKQDCDRRGWTIVRKADG